MVMGTTFCPPLIQNFNRKAYICNIITVLVLGSVDRERGFSVFNEIKEDFRGRAQDEHLEAVMRITLTPMDPITLASKHRPDWCDVGGTWNRGDRPMNLTWKNVLNN